MYDKAKTKAQIAAIKARIAGEKPDKDMEKLEYNVVPHGRGFMTMLGKKKKSN